MRVNRCQVIYFLMYLIGIIMVLILYKDYVQIPVPLPLMTQVSQ